MSQLETLSEQLGSNLEQLAQLDQLLVDDPDNAELRSIRDDLQQVIQVTLELQKEQAATAAAASTTAAPSPTAAAAAAPAYAPSSSSSSYAPTSAFAAAAAASSSSAFPVAASASASSPASSFLPTGPGGTWRPGSRVMAVYSKDGKWYVSRVDGVDEGSETYKVTYLEYDQAASVPFEHVKAWVHATPEQLKLSNTPIKALYPEDGLFYAASLDGPASTPGYYCVKFGAAVGAMGKKKKKVEIPIADIMINERFMNPLSMQLTSAASANAKAAAAPLGPELVTPDHLQSQPGDSDATRAQKAKKLKKLKFEHKKAYEEQQGNARKNSWLDFKSGKTAAGGASKKAKLTHAPGLQQLNKTSMFATPDGLEGVVGVVGSGRGMTESAALKKHIFTEDAAAAAAQQQRPAM